MNLYRILIPNILYFILFVTFHRKVKNYKLLFLFKHTYIVF